MATVNWLKYLTQKSDDRMAIVLPAELKEKISEKSKNDKMNISQWVKIAVIEKLMKEQ